jgi:hypothetical protein
MGVGNDPTYNNTRCFLPFPFPDASAEQQGEIGRWAEKLDGYRKDVQARHPDVTLTGMYNVLAKVRSGEKLTAKEQVIHTRLATGELARIHDELDAAVFAAYGWPGDLSDDEILERLVALNQERAAEEARGQVRWLRPPEGPTAVVAAQQTHLPAAAAPVAKQPWPKDPLDQLAAILETVQASPQPLTADEVAARFKSARRKRLAEILDRLAERSLVVRDEQARYLSLQRS